MQKSPFPLKLGLINPNIIFYFYISFTPSGVFRWVAWKKKLDTSWLLYLRLSGWRIRCVLQASIHAPQTTRWISRSSSYSIAEHLLEICCYSDRLQMYILPEELPLWNETYQRSSVSRRQVSSPGLHLREVSSEGLSCQGDSVLVEWMGTVGAAVQ